MPSCAISAFGPINATFLSCVKGNTPSFFKSTALSSAALRANALTERHARALLRLPTEEMKLQTLHKAVALGFSVARLESYIEELLTPQKANIGLFLNNLNQSLSRIQRCGVAAVSERRETDKQIVFTITIPKE